MQTYKKNSLFLIYRILLLVGVYFSLRIFFLLWNFSHFRNENIQDIFSAFMTGFRFDLSAIFFINFIFILLSLIPISFNNYKLNLFHRHFLRHLYFWPNSAFIILNLFDIEYWNFTGRRITRDSSAMINELNGKIIPIISTYWLISSISLLILIAFWYCYPRSKFEKDRKLEKIGLLRVTFQYFVALCLIVICARGGFQPKPLSFANGWTFTSSALNSLQINSTFSLLASYTSPGITVPQYFSDEQKIYSLIRQEPRSDSPTIPFPNGPRNVVLIIVESLAREYMGYNNPFAGNSPFIDSLAKKGLAFDQSFSNSRRSIDAIAAILGGIPDLLDEHFIASSYQNTRFFLVGKFLKEHNYHTSFFHGGHDGTMFFDTFTLRLGIDHYFGYNAFPEKNPETDDGAWGIFDEPFLNFMADHLNQFPQPFFSTVFTLTSHHPYPIPPHLKSQFPEGKLEIYKTVAYTDFAIKQFFAKVEKTKWYPNTLFILTGDHTQMNGEPSYNNSLGQFRVPIILFHPSIDLKKWVSQKPAQQIDIVPTIVDYSGNKPTTETYLGKSLLKDYVDPYTIAHLNGIFWLATNEFYVESNLISSTKYFTMAKPGEEAPTSPHPELEDKLKAILQYFYNGVLNNQLMHSTVTEQPQPVKNQL